MIFEYNTQSYFPPHIKIIGFLMIIIGIPSLFVNWMIAIIILVIGLFTVSAKYGLTIDMQRKKYKDYLQMFWLKTGSEQSFELVEKLYITSGLKTTKMQFRGHATNLNELEYNGYIKFSDDQKIHLISSVLKEEVEKKLSAIANDLSINIEDLS